MRYQLLGRSGLRVSEICLGALTFGEDWGWGASKDEARKLYDTFRDAGGNFVDTANVYTGGTSEKFLGEFMSGHRDEIVLVKYTGAAPGKDPNAAGNHRKSMMQAVEASLKRLQTDRIDLYWMHIWDQITPVEEVMRGLDDLVRQGKVHYVGVSDVAAWWVAQANTLAELRGWRAFTGLQIEYSLLERTPERELIPMAAALGLTVTAWSPLANGLLSGKYRVTDTGVQSEEGKSRLDNSEMQQFIRQPRASQPGGGHTQDGGERSRALARANRPGVAASAATACHSHRGRSQAGAARSQPGDCRLAPFKRASARLKMRPARSNWDFPTTCWKNRGRKL